MATSKVSSQTLKDIEQYTKYMIYKCTQVIVQSRQGTKIHVPSKQFSSKSDWFNISIRDNPDILSEIKAAFNGRPINLQQPYCIETYLQTSESETVTLEYWWLRTTEKAAQMDVPGFVSLTVYNYIGHLLKSLVTVTRITPAYQLSRRQTSGAYEVRHRIIFGEPQFQGNEDDFRQELVGMVRSPTGSITMRVAYKTRLSICPRRLSSDIARNIRDDYFNVEAGTGLQRGTFDPRQGDGNRNTDFTSDVLDNTCHASSPVNRQSPASGRRRNSSGNYEEPPSRFGSPLDTDNKSSRTTWHGSPTVREYGNFMTSGSPDSRDSVWTRNKKAAFGLHQDNNGIAENDEFCEDLPFASLLQQAKASPILFRRGSPLEHLQPYDAFKDGRRGTPDSPHGMHHSGDSTASHGSSNRDDFVMVELKAPFAGQEEELGKFYRECQTAPSLSMFQQPSDLNETLNSITDQLALFEANAPEFNEFVNSLEEHED